MESKIYDVPADWKRRAYIDEAKYKAMYEASVRDPEAFWLVTDTLYYNQHEQVVAVNHNTLIRHRDRAQIAATTPEQLALLPAP